MFSSGLAEMIMVKLIALPLLYEDAEEDCATGLLAENARLRPAASEYLPSSFPVPTEEFAFGFARAWRRLHVDRTAGSHCDYCNFGRHAASGAGPGEIQGAANQMPQ